MNIVDSYNKIIADPLITGLILAGITSIAGLILKRFFGQNVVKNTLNSNHKNIIQRIQSKRLLKKYNEDTYRGIKFKWKYEKDIRGYVIKDLRSVCCNCGGELQELIYNVDQGINWIDLYCPKCDLYGIKNLDYNTYLNYNEYVALNIYEKIDKALG